MSNLKRIWTGMLTREGRWDGSRNQTVLIVNQRGKDQLHHTFPKGNPPHQGRGQANLYEIDVTANEIDTERLNTCSIRMGLRGQDYWRPQNVMVWGELADKNQIIPLAAERDLAVKVSHDPKEGPISFPLRPIGAGADDMSLTHLILMIKTAEVKDAGSNSQIRLKIIANKKAVLDYSLPDTPQADHETGQANIYMIPLEKGFSKSMLQASSIRLINSGFDSWLPKSCFLFGYNQKARRAESLVTLVHLFEWSFGWLSSDVVDNAKRAVVLPLFSQDHPHKGNGKRKPTPKVKAEKKEANKEKKQQAKAEKKEANKEKKQQAKAEKKEANKEKRQQAKAEKQKAKAEKQQANKEKRQQAKAEKQQANKEKRQQMKAEKKEANKEKRQQAKAEKKEAKNEKRQDKVHSKNGSQHSQNGHSKTSRRKISKSNGRQQTQTQGEWVFVESSSSTQEQITTIQTAELVPA